MQHLLSRLAWPNLPIRVKTGLIFVSQMGLISAMAVVGLLVLTAVQSQIGATVTSTLEMRTLALDIQLEVESLERLQTNLIDDYPHPGFDPTVSSLPAEYASVVEQLEADTQELAALSEQIAGGRAAQSFQVQILDFLSNVTGAHEDFEDSFAIVSRLTDPQTGAIATLRAHGNALQASTLLLADTDLITQVVVIRGLENTLLQTGAAEDRDALLAALDRYERTYLDVVPPEQQNDALEHLTAYRETVQVVASLLNDLSITDRAADTSLVLARATASRLSNLTDAQVGAPLATIDLILGRSRVTLVVVVAISVTVGLVVTVLFSRSVTGAILPVLDVARRLEAGNLRVRVPVRGEDEFNQLGATFNAMAVQLEGLVSGLEQRVAERTRDLSITADIGRAVIALRDPRELMNEIVELIRQRFGFYHAQIFLVDDAAENAVLVASTGTAGRELLARRHTLAVGSQSVIGQVTAQAAPVIASDTDVSIVHRRNELLPDTRSEMALPMRIGEKVIGSLDVQSVAPNAFDEDDIAVFQIMADQLAIALENARLFSQLEESRRDLALVEQQMTREAWRSFEDARQTAGPIGFQLKESQVEPLSESSPLMSEAIQSGQIVTHEDGGADYEMAIPIRVRGEVIGAFGFAGEALQHLTDDDITLIEAVVDRVGLALENLRLVEQTTRRAEHEQVINAITAKIVGSTDVDHILQTTVRELGRVLRAPQTSVQLRRERADDEP